MKHKTEVAIIGGGLSGLALAAHLQTAGIDYLVLEARSRLGGRIQVARSDTGAFDLGPAWFWPGQPRMAALIKQYGLGVFEQYSTGALCFEDETARIQRGQGYAFSMAGSYRIKGGISALVDQLAQSLPPDRILLNCPVTAIRDDGQISVHTNIDKDQVITADRVVLALPPRVAAEMQFEPALPPQAVTDMRAIQTWMAGHAKIVAVYERPFWRDAGLSGDAMSHRGPLVEIHDASDPDSGLGALFGFVGVPAPVRKGQADAIKAAAVQQFARLFGEQALSPRAIFFQDWAFESTTSTELDLTPPGGHPVYGLPDSLTALWNKRLQLGSTEIAPQFGGYLEGALEAAEQLAGVCIAAKSA